MNLPLDKIWQEILEKLEKIIIDKNILKELYKCKLFLIDNGKAYILVKDVLWLNIIKIKFVHQINQLLNEILNTSINVELINNEKDINKKKSSVDKFNLSRVNLNYRFDNFIIDKNNESVRKLCIKMSSDKKCFFSPLFIYGESGLGKTHLLMAIVNNIKNSNSNIAYGYYSSPDLISYIIGLFRKKQNKTINELYLFLTNLDLLIIDDIQFFKNKKETNQFLFRVVDAFIQKDKNLIISGDERLDNIKNISKRLTTRLNKGANLLINKPSFKLKLRILKFWIKKNENNADNKFNHNFSGEAIETMANVNVDNIRELDGLYKTILFWIINNNKYIEVIGSNLIKKIIREKYKQEFVKKRNRKNETSYNKIISTVAKELFVSEEEILGKKRFYHIQLARNFSIYFVREKINLSYKKIAFIFKRDHSTIISSVKRIKVQISKDKKIKKIYKELNNKIV